MPARRGVDGFSKEERIALLLNCLYTKPGHRATTDQLRRQLAPYHAAAGVEPSPEDLARWERMMDRDVHDLVGRGIVERFAPTDSVEDPGVRARSGVRLRMPDKPERLMLSADEHAALALARSLVRPGPPLTSPLVATDTADLDHLDLALITLRYLEETGTSATVDELANYLGRDSRAVRSALEHLADIDSALFSACMLSMEYDDSGRLISGVSIDTNRQQQPGHRTGRGGGMNPLARFAYTRAEARERLSLIDEAMTQATDNDEYRQALRGARFKLEDWLRVLDRALS